MIIRKVQSNNIEDAIKIVANSNCDKIVYNKLAKKIVSSAYIVDDIDNRAANILKQDALSCGCDVAVDKNVSLFEKGTSTVVICANYSQIEKLISKISNQPFKLKELSEKLLEIHNFEPKQIVCSNRVIPLQKPLVMGIVNLSPDSFFQNGIEDEQKAVDLALQMEQDGADIIDVGAESTRPGSQSIDIDVEQRKIQKFLQLLRKQSNISVSVDTYKPAVADVALQEGADIINDIYALRYDNNKMVDVVAKYKAAVILMHMLETPLTMQSNIQYNNTLLDIFKFLSKQVDFALSNGINKESVIVDPGIGFGKTVEDNLLIVKRLFDFKSLNMPILMALSNKSFIGKVIESNNLEDRIIPNVIANILSVQNGANILRVHNVKEVVMSLKLYNSIKGI